MQMKGISLRGLEVFEALARSGSVAQAAQDTGLSQPAVSQQMRNLETTLGARLVDHARRPMRLTPAGRNFLRRATAALSELRLATAEVGVMDLADLEDLSLGISTDFEEDLTPHLSVILAESLRGRRFRLASGCAGSLLEQVAAGELHLAIAAGAGAVAEGLTEYPLARDPFILITPPDTREDAATLLRGGASLPFLRYGPDQMIARQIESYLKLEHASFPVRFEIASHRALMSLVAHGEGWTITTPTGFLRAGGFGHSVVAHPLPGAGAARQISLYAGAEWGEGLPGNIAVAARGLIERRMIAPAIDKLPWLDGAFHLS